MIFLSDLERITDEKFKVKSVHYCPFDKKDGLGKTQEELKQEGILVDSLIEPNIPNGKTVKGTYINPKTKEVWYEYEDRPLTDTEKNARLENQINDLNIALAKVLGGV